MFPDTDKEIVNELWMQSGKNQQLLIDAMLKLQGGENKKVEVFPAP